jgi:hypothetical protein
MKTLYKNQFPCLKTKNKNVYRILMPHFNSSFISRAFQSISLQPLVNMLHDSSEIIYKDNRGHTSPTFHTLNDTNTTMPHRVKDKFKMPPSQNECFLRLYMKSVPSLQRVITPNLYIFDILQENNSKHTLYG